MLSPFSAAIWLTETDEQARMDAKLQTEAAEAAAAAEASASAAAEAEIKAKEGRQRAVSFAQETSAREAERRAAIQQRQREIYSATKIAAVIRGKAARNRVKRVRKRTMDLEARFFTDFPTSSDEEEEKDDDPLHAAGETAVGSGEADGQVEFDAAAIMDDIGATVVEEEHAVTRVQAMMRGKWGRQKQTMAKARAARGFSSGPDLERAPG